MKLGTNQKKWITALRSGDYTQTGGLLQDEHGHCCLGVGCSVVSDQVTLDLTNEDFIDGEDLSMQPGTREALGLGDPSGCVKSEIKGKPSTHRQALKFVADEYGVGHDGCTSVLTLARLNDDNGLTFDQIADLLEKFPELYFTEAK